MLLLIAGATAAAALLLALSADITFIYEEWDWLLHRHEFVDFLRPVNEHLVLVPTALYATLRSVFGMRSGFPYDLVSIGALLTSASLLFVYLRRCVGDWPALAATIVVLFLGAAFDVLLWPLGLAFVGSTAAGLGMLLALQREDVRGDAAACVLLVVSIAFMSLGLIFAVGAATAIALHPVRRLARSYIVTLPLLVYAGWYVGWGSEAQSAVSLENLAAAPRFMLEGIASNAAALLGLFALQPHVGSAARLAGGVMITLAVAALAYRQVRRGRGNLRSSTSTRWVWVTAVLFVGFWFVTALNQVSWRPPSASRYMYPSTILLLLLLAEWFRGVHATRRTLLAVAALTSVAVAGNIVALFDGRDALRRESETANAQLGALQIASKRVPAAFIPAYAEGGSPALIWVDAGSYLAGRADFGSPADHAGELADHPRPIRVSVDLVLANALGLDLQHAPHRSDGAGLHGCRSSLKADAARGIAVRLPSGRIRLQSLGGSSEVRLRRFSAPSFPVDLGELGRREAAILRIPRDTSSQPWELKDTAAITVCDPRAAPARSQDT